MIEKQTTLSEVNTSDSSKKRVQLDFSPRMFDTLNELTSRIDAASRAELIRRAISIYSVLLDESDAGNRVEIVNPKTGEKNRLVLP